MFEVFTFTVMIKAINTKEKESAEIEPTANWVLPSHRIAAILIYTCIHSHLLAHSLGLSLCLLGISDQMDQVLANFSDVIIWVFSWKIQSSSHLSIVKRENGGAICLHEIQPVFSCYETLLRIKLAPSRAACNLAHAGQESRNEPIRVHSTSLRQEN